MPTLVRVRGKRRKAGAGDSNEAQIERQPKRKEAKLRQPENRLSLLEELPTEILQAIFLLCPNFELINASPVLSQKLASEHIKVSLTIKYFFEGRHGPRGANWPVNDPDDLFEEPEDGPPEDYSLDLTRRETQIALLAAKWMDYEFMRKCQWKIHLQKTTAQLKHFLRASPREYLKAQVTLLRGRLTNYFNRYESRADPADPAHWSGCYAVQREADGRIFSVEPVPEAGECCVFAIHIFHHPELLGPLEGSDPLHLPLPDFEMVAMEGRILNQMPTIVEGCALPEAYTSGRWTQDRGDMLKLVLDSSAYVTRTYFGVQLSLTADIWGGMGDMLTSAIEARCLVALAALLVSNYSDAGRINSRLATDRLRARRGFVFEPPTEVEMEESDAYMEGFGRYHRLIESVQDIPEPQPHSSSVERPGLTTAAGGPETLLAPSRYAWCVLKGEHRSSELFNRHFSVRHLELSVRLADRAEKAGTEPHAAAQYFAVFKLLADYVARHGMSKQAEEALEVLAENFSRNELGDRRQDLWFMAYMWLRSRLERQPPETRT